MQQLELIARKKRIGRITKELHEVFEDITAMLVNDLFIYRGIITPKVLRANIWKWIERTKLHGTFKSFIYKRKLYLVRVE